MSDPVSLLLTARTVALVGASERAGSSAGYALKNLMARGFAGTIRPVHPSAATVFGLAAFPSLAALPEVPDAILIGVAAERVAGVVDEAGRLGIRAAVVLASGFAETGPAGRALQDDLAAAARRHGMALCGPNCLGVFVPATGLALYSSTLPPTPAGGVAIVSHSGALGLTVAHSGRLGVRALISAGNGAVTDLADYVSALADDCGTKVTALILERISDTAGFARAVAKARAAGTAVVALRAGRSETGAAASAAHTGSLAGADAAFIAFFRRAGVIAVDDLAGLIETAALLCAPMPALTAPGVALVGVSGGAMAHASDIADAAGLVLPALAAGTRERIAGLLPGFATVQNPLDLTGLAFGEPAVYAGALAALAEDPAIGLIVAVQDVPLGLDAAGAEEYRGIATSIAAAWRAGLPVVFVNNVPGGPHPLVRAILDEAGVPVLEGTQAGLRAVAALVAPPCGRAVVADVTAADPVWRARLATGAPLSEREALAFLGHHGLEGPRERFAAGVEAAVAAAAAIGFPVAMKIVSPDIAHKTEAGGVALGLGDAAAVAAAHARMLTAVVAHSPAARIEGVSVQEMVTGGVEALVGLSRHATFGLTLTVGMGGVLVELLKDAALDVLPVDAAAAEDLIGRTRLGSLLAGWRGAPACDRAALVAAIVRLAGIAAAYGDVIEAVDLNPVAVLPQGRGVRLLDALVVPRVQPGLL